MLTTSSAFFCNGQQPVKRAQETKGTKESQGPHFGNLPAQRPPSASQPIHANGSDLELDQALKSTLDEFEKMALESGQKTPVPADHAQRVFQNCIQETLARLRESWAAPPEEKVLGVKPRKWEVAHQLSDWMQDTLNKQGVQLAVVARQGGLQHKKYDKTGMLHTGIAMYHPREKRWKIYNLIDRAMMGGPVCEVQWVEPAGFFAQQGGYRKDALLLIPSKPVQQRMQQALLNGDYRKLVFTPDYNLVSAPGSETSLNCNKWILLNVLAARHDSYEPKKLLADVRDNYKPGNIDVHPLVRLFAVHQPKVKASEVPWMAPIHTVTVESLLNSGLFEKHEFCEPRPAE